MRACTRRWPEAAEPQRPAARSEPAVRCRYPRRISAGGACRTAPVTVWFKGWIEGHDADALAARFAHERPSRPISSAICSRRSIGHFAIAATGPGWAFAAVDWVRSIPLAVAQVAGRWTIDDQPERLRRSVLASAQATSIRMRRLPSAWRATPSMTRRSIAASQLAGAGRIGLHRGQHARAPSLLHLSSLAVRRHRPMALEAELKDLTLHLIERMLQHARRTHAAGAAQRRARLPPDRERGEASGLQECALLHLWPRRKFRGQGQQGDRGEARLSLDLCAGNHRQASALLRRVETMRAISISPIAAARCRSCRIWRRCWN